MPDALTQLGRTSALTERQVREPRTILESFPNPRPERDYEIEFVFPEFTSVCPVTGQPDFATITVRYVPDRLCVEMKSLKLYFYAFRNKGIFYEGVVNQILDDLVATVRPRFMRVVGAFNVRGGTAGTVTAEHRQEPGGGKARKKAGASGRGAAGRNGRQPAGDRPNGR